jgi:LacI family transcriptional regulator
MTTRVTLTDVARAAEVDVSLVSRVVRGKDVKVREETRARILEQVRVLGYRPNAIARSLKSARAGAFGLVIPNFENPVYAQIIAGAETAAARLGSVMMTTSGAGWDRADWYESLDGGRVDGLLIAGGSGLDLSHLRVPFLLVNRTAPGVDRFVVLDDEGAARMAVEHLVQLGHHDLAFVGGPLDADTAGRRQAGFESAVKAAGARGRVLPGDYTTAGGRAAVVEVLSTGTPPTGIIAANLPSGIGVLEALRDAGVSVPGAVSVVSVHDAEIAQFIVPKLTTVRMPLHQLGARAIEQLSTLAPTDTITDVVTAPMELMVRESTGPAPL